MLIQILGFGTNWWARNARSISEEPSSCRQAYYNSTGVHCGRKILRHWTTAGLIRFNGVVDFDPEAPEMSIGETFICSGLVRVFGGNRLVVQAKSAKRLVPEFYLVVVSSNLHGHIEFSSKNWKSVFTQVIAASHLREAQEAMLLMSPGDWLQTSHGFWQLHASSRTSIQAELVRIGEPTEA